MDAIMYKATHHHTHIGSLHKWCFCRVLDMDLVSTSQCTTHLPEQMFYRLGVWTICREAECPDIPVCSR